MSHLKYGPRFKQSVVSVHYPYNGETDAHDKKHRAQTARMMENMPLYKKQLAHHSAGKVNRKKHENHGVEREASELRMAEALRKCVAILEFHMSDMMQHKQSSTRPHHVFQEAVHNTIWQLRNRCGVSFDHNPEYAHPIGLAGGNGGMTQEQKRDAVRAEIEQQRLARLRNVREMARRFEKYQKDMEARTK